MTVEKSIRKINANEHKSLVNKNTLCESKTIISFWFFLYTLYYNLLCSSGSFGKSPYLSFKSFISSLVSE